MDSHHISTGSFSRDLPRRLRLSAREIAVAVALTFAAVIQLMFSLASRDGGRDGKAGITDRNEPAAFIRPVRQG